MTVHSSSRVGVMRFALIMVAAVALLAACSGEAPPVNSPTRTRSYVWGGPKNLAVLPILAGIHGYFREEHLNIRPNFVQTGKIAMDAVVSGDLDIGIIVDTNIAFMGFQQGADIQVVACLMEKTDDAIIARRDAGISVPKDLEGKSLAILNGTTTHRFADLFIDHNGLDRKRIELVNMSPPAAQAALLNGQIAAATLWQPYRYNLLHQLGDKVVEFRNEGIYRASALVAVRGEFARKDPESVKEFLRAVIKTEEFVLTEPDKAITELSKVLEIEAPVLKQIWPEYDPRVTLKPAALESTFREEADWIRRSQPGFADKPAPSYDKVVNGRFLEEVSPNRVVGGDGKQ